MNASSLAVFFGIFNIFLYERRFQRVKSIYPMKDPSAALRTPMRAGPNDADRVLGDKERRVMEIF